MAAPVLISAQASELAVLLTFDQPVVSSTGAPGAGWTVRVNGVPVALLAAMQPSPADIQLSVVGVIRVDDFVDVAYSASTGNLTDVSTAFPVASIVVTPITNLSACAGLLAPVLALLPDDAKTISLIFSDWVTSTSFLTGLTVKINGTAVAPVSAGPAGDPRILKIVFAALIEPTDTVTVSYDAGTGDWKTRNAYVMPSFTDVPVNNAANTANPYPLSTVIQEPLEAERSDIEATVGVDLCYIDNALVGRYGPARVDFGGTFGITLANPTGIFIPQDYRELSAGMQVTKIFSSPNHPDWAAAAGADWLNQVTTRIGQALGILRATDKEVILGALKIVQV